MLSEISINTASIISIRTCYTPVHTVDKYIASINGKRVDIRAKPRVGGASLKG